MSRNEYLIKRARKAADRRKRIFGIDPPPGAALLLEREPPAFNIRESLRLLIYVLFHSPRHRLDLFWRHLTDRDTPLRSRQIELLGQDLRSLLSEGTTVATRFFERRNYSHDLARVPSFLATALFRTTPYLVVQPREEKDIVKILEFGRARELPVIPRGAASSAFGGAVPTRNGIVVDLSPMMAILEINPKKQTIKVQPGARWADVAGKLESFGLAPKTTPTSRFSTVAGWISTGGLGLDSYGYGSVFEAVAGIRVARADGTIEELDAGNESIKDLFGTEGQFGILTEITLHVRSKPKYSRAHLLSFDSPEHALDFIDRINSSGYDPSHVFFFDRQYMKRENTLFGEQNRKEDTIVPESETVLLHFETPEGEQKFLSSSNGKEGQIEANRLSALQLWSDRFFPFKAQRIGPGLLGSEVVIPGKEASKYITDVRKLARHFRINPAVEVIVGRKGESLTHLVILSFACDYSRSIHYLLSLLFNQLLVRMAGKYRGYPYGIGIWNTPFVGYKYTPAQLKRLKGIKNELDPGQTLNPNKFFKIKGRFFSIPALALRPAFFSPVMAFARWMAPVLGLIVSLSKPRRPIHWELPEPEENQGENFLKQCAQRCTSCGSCLSVCPAYRITRDELVAGRTKLRMAEILLKDEELTQSEAHRTFQCLHCGLCEEVCQTHLPLRDSYLVLENWLEARFGSPEETVRSFVARLEENRDFIEDVFGLDLPEWSPEIKPARVPKAQKISEEGRA
jgi:FAD/FMN-containing dehydrogenase/ferredoxin